ncbi:hypothetical protein CIB95_04525 [Lottiidibacillus patelloidae]|uniref:Metal-dependent enzyme n=1 Tax=Lottiidibacillus patelloidae TaxID=2670334 RepID=A0A263BVS3_9BACI|nr:DUF1385 domain-containing protein [Lottiidibacillus patelloidae]OZM57642.1 hypothetical protein CIB95_04525 [Lottiidibacillus patelloidae]
MTNKKQSAYGGQAIVEGVMFNGKHCTVSAIRRKDNSIDYFTQEKQERPVLNKLKKVPFLRGLVAIVEASAIGSKHLTFASDRYDVDPKEEEKVFAEQKQSKMTLIFGAAFIGIISFIFAKLVFTGLPAIVAHTLKPIDIFSGHIAQNLVEGAIKFIFLLGYIYFISLTPLIKRVFQYHGAEHMVINAYEAKVPLTIKNVQNQSRLHYRCGSSFILFTVIVGIFIYLFVPSDPLLVRLAYRVALIPVVLGVAFEFLQLTNKLREVPVLRFIGYPGLWLQLLTTKKPDDDQVEVAIASFNKMLSLENELRDEKAV